MNKKEFLNQLQNLLSAQLPRQKVLEYISYYDQYISEEVKKGKKDSDVISELGGARIIAKSILDNEKLSRKYSGDCFGYENVNDFEDDFSNKESYQKTKDSQQPDFEFRFDYNGHEINPTVAKVLVVLVSVAALAIILGIFIVLFRVLGWIVEILAPFILFGVILFFLKIFRKRK